MSNAEYAGYRVENPTHELDRMDFFTPKGAHKYAMELVELGFSPIVTIWDGSERKEISLDDLADKII